MAFAFFTIPIQNGEAAEVELNTFLRTHSVLSVDRRWVDQGPSSFWAFSVDYLDPAATGAKSWHFRRAVLEQLPVSGRRPRTG